MGKTHLMADLIFKIVLEGKNSSNGRIKFGDCFWKREKNHLMAELIYWTCLEEGKTPSMAELIFGLFWKGKTPSFCKINFSDCFRRGNPILWQNNRRITDDWYRYFR